MPGKTKTRIVGVSIEQEALGCSVLETVRGVVVGYNDEAELVIQEDLGELDRKAREALGQRIVQLGKKILLNKPQLH